MPGPEACGIAQGAVMHFWSRNPSSSGGTAFSFFWGGRLAVSHKSHKFFKIHPYLREITQLTTLPQGLFVQEISNGRTHWKDEGTLKKPEYPIARSQPT